jgi:hypothetical protein
MRTETVIVFDIPMTRGAMRQFLEVLEKVFLFQGALKGDIECFFRTEDQIEEQSRKIEQHHQQCRKHLSDDAAASGLAIAISPNNEYEPKCHEVRDRQCNEDLDTSGS